MMVRKTRKTRIARMATNAKFARLATRAIGSVGSLGLLGKLGWQREFRIARSSWIARNVRIATSRIYSRMARRARD